MDDVHPRLREPSFDAGVSCRAAHRQDQINGIEDPADKPLVGPERGGNVQAVNNDEAAGAMAAQQRGQWQNKRSRDHRGKQNGVEGVAANQGPQAEVRPDQKRNGTDVYPAPGALKRYGVQLQVLAPREFFEQLFGDTLHAARIGQGLTRWG
jgi:hypothetical protein